MALSNRDRIGKALNQLRDSQRFGIAPKQAVVLAQAEDGWLV